MHKSFKREEETNWGGGGGLPVHASHMPKIPFSFCFYLIFLLAMQVPRQKLKTRGSRNFGKSPFSRPACNRNGQLE